MKDFRFEEFQYKEKNVLITYYKTQFHGIIKLYKYHDCERRKDDYRLTFYLNDGTNHEKLKHYWNETKKFGKEHGWETFGLLSVKYIEGAIRNRVGISLPILRWLYKEELEQMGEIFKEMRDNDFNSDEIDHVFAGVTLSKVEYLLRKQNVIFIGYCYNISTLCFNNVETAQLWESRFLKCIQEIGASPRAKIDASQLMKQNASDPSTIQFPMIGSQMTFIRNGLLDTGVLELKKGNDDYYLKFTSDDRSRLSFMLGISTIIREEQHVGSNKKPDKSGMVPRSSLYFDHEYHTMSGSKYRVRFLFSEEKERIKWTEAIYNLRYVNDKSIDLLK